MSSDHQGRRPARRGMAGLRLRTRCLRSTALTRVAGLVGSSIMVGLLGGGHALANPEGGTVVSGSASISQTSAQQLDIVQDSDRAVIDWRGFDIAPDETTSFQQPSAGSVTLNRVNSADPSSIDGNLNANGRVYLVNPNGVVFGEGAQVNVGGLVATTSDIGNADFMAGRDSFDRPSPNPDARVVNQGTIHVADRGLAALVAPGVENSGTITARLGEVELAGARSFALDPNGDGLVSFQVGAPVETAPAGADAQVINSGRIEAANVRLTAAALDGVVDNAIDMSGVIEARGYSMQGGTIVLSGAGAGGMVDVSGRLDAAGGAGQTGGQVAVLGDRVALTGAAAVDVSGDAGGGQALIGGNYQGKGPERNASRTFIDAGASVSADAGSSGDGGRVIVWSDEATYLVGTISARGGLDGGDGGFVETSSKGSLGVSGTVDAGAPNGAPGTWLLDPENIIIGAVGFASFALGEPDPISRFFNDDPGTDYVVSGAAVSAATAYVVLQARRNISVFDEIAMENAGVGLVFQAGDDIDIEAPISTQGGFVHLEADSPHADDGGSGTVHDGSGTIFLSIPCECEQPFIETNGGDVTLIAAGFDIDGFIDAGDGAVDIARSFDNDALVLGSDLDEFELDAIDTTGIVTLGEAQTAGSAGDFADSVTLSQAVEALGFFDAQVEGGLTFAGPLFIDDGLFVDADGPVTFNEAISGLESNPSLFVSTTGNTTFEGPVGSVEQPFSTVEVAGESEGGAFRRGQDVSIGDVLYANDLTILVDGDITSVADALHLIDFSEDPAELLVGGASARLFGSIGDVSGPDAAPLGEIDEDEPNPNLLLNNCVISESPVKCVSSIPGPVYHPEFPDPASQLPKLGPAGEALTFNQQPLFFPATPNTQDDELLTNSGNEELWIEAGVGAQ